MKLNQESSKIQLNIEDLAINPVDQKSPVPLYHQITLDLRRMIEDGTIRAGAIFPPETEICVAYGVGRQTVRRAMARLVDENLIDRYAGRGTFVRNINERVSFHLDRSFSQHVRDMGIEPSSKLLNQEEGLVDREVPQLLRKFAGEPLLNLERIRFGDLDPICYQLSTILTKKCQGLSNHNFNRESLYEVLANDYGLIITRIEHVIRAVAADDYRAELLEVEEGTPLLFVTTCAYLEDGEIIEMTMSHYRADKFEYRTEEER
jgi:GntR family transcriptional regulator